MYMYAHIRAYTYIYLYDLVRTYTMDLFLQTGLHPHFDRMAIRLVTEGGTFRMSRRGAGGSPKACNKYLSVDD